MQSSVERVSEPLISVVMPVYNAEKYVATAVKSVLAQTIDCWELIVVDDGSSDDPRSRLDPYMTESRISYFRQDNQGVSAARNAGLARAKGDWIAFLDADDALTPHSLECRMKLLTVHPDLAFIDGRVDTCDARLEACLTSWTPSFSGPPFEALLFQTERCFRAPTWLVRNKRGLKPFKPGMTHGEDLLFFLMNAENGEYSFVEDTILLYRTGHASAMNNLEGLERGYRTLYREIKTSFPRLSPDQLENVRRKYISIMRRGYLKRGALWSALRVSERFAD
jgi:glycosyltransferase involved in cell wall biosynthesis